MLTWYDWDDFRNSLYYECPSIDHSSTESAIYALSRYVRPARKERERAQKPEIFWCETFDEFMMVYNWLFNRKFWINRVNNKWVDSEICPWSKLQRFINDLRKNNKIQLSNPLGSNIKLRLYFSINIPMRTSINNFCYFFKSENNPSIQECEDPLLDFDFLRFLLINEYFGNDERINYLDLGSEDWARDYFYAIHCKEKCLKDTKRERYFKKILEPFYQRLKSFFTIYKNTFFCLLFARGCILLERPKHILQNFNGSYHDSSGPAIEWHNGTKEWYLNGVKVTREIVETPADELDARILYSYDNAEVRREIIRKIGVERAIRDLGAKSIDNDGNYELVLLDLGDDMQRPYLKMKNPSTGTYHLEGVHPDCRTVTQAINWRNESEEKPCIIT